MLGCGGSEERCGERYGDVGNSKERCGGVKKCGGGVGECMGKVWRMWKR